MGLLVKTYVDPFRPPAVDVSEQEASPSVTFPSAQPPSPEPAVTLSPRPEPSSSPTAPPLPAVCRSPASSAFEPTRLDVAGEGSWPVIAMGRDADGTPQAPARNGSYLPWEAGWDRLGPPPAYGLGNVGFTAHRYPNSPSLGNLMLQKLSEGDLLVVRGANGERLCVRVYDRIEVATTAYPEARVYDVHSQPQEYVFTVCSGERLGPGNWTKRTIWFARPVK